MQINLKPDLKTLEKYFTETIREKYLSEANHQLARYFADKRNPYMTEDGEGTQWLKAQIDGFLLDASFKTKVEAYLEKHFDRILEEACIKAMTHRANALAFNHPLLKEKALQGEHHASLSTTGQEDHSSLP